MDECKPLAAGMDGCIQKPIREAELLKIVDTFIAHDDHGRTMLVQPIKPTLKAPGTKRLRLKCEELLSSFAFNPNLRR